jgi:hypothetical protein
MEVSRAMRGVAMAVVALVVVVGPVLAQETGQTRSAPSSARERSGIAGEPIALDASNPEYGEFLAKVRERIRVNWAFPCVRSETSRTCEYRSARVSAEFGVLEGGQLKFVEITRSSGLPIYDDYARNAIMLASPYPRVPPELMAAMKPGSGGAVIAAEFSYFSETRTTSLSRGASPVPRVPWSIPGLPTAVREEAP